MSKSKFTTYVVWKGHNPGVYSNWSQAHEQLKGYSSPVFKAFVRADIAQKAFNESPEKYLSEQYIEPPIFDFEKEKIHKSKVNQPKVDALTVDAACAGNPGEMEYRGVDLLTKKEIFKQGPFPMGTNNIGEFLAIVHALALMDRNNDLRPIFSDSITAIDWVKKKQARTQLARNEQTKALYELIARAENWLKTHQWKNEIIKWDTAHWGEIPADFGRK